MSGLSLDDVHKWREAAIADGWDSYPTYPGYESVEWACTFKKNGWTAMLLARPKRPCTYTQSGFAREETSISVWGPDSLAVDPVIPYDMAQLEKNLRKCGACEATDVETKCVAFCNRVCLECRPSERKKLETPGWCD